MKNRRILMAVLICCGLAIQSYAEGLRSKVLAPTDTIDQVPTVSISEQIEQIRVQTANITVALSAMQESFRQIRNEHSRDIRNVNNELGKSRDTVQLLASNLTVLEGNIKCIADQLNVRIDQTDRSVEGAKARTESGIHSLLIYFLIGFIILLFIAVAVYTMLHRRIGLEASNMVAIKETSHKLEEQAIALDNRLAEVLQRQLETDERLHKMADQVSNSAERHSLILSIANEMARIDQNLAFMDQKTKGVSQLRNRSKAIAASLAAKGYEILSLVGTDYKEGMNMEALMEEDDNIEPGRMVIRRVTQPCVLYRGKMIQAAKVVVAYNPEQTE